MVPRIICEEEREENMVANLRVNFKERQRKCLSESIMVIHPPAKKPCTEIICPELISTIAPAPEPSAAAAGTSHVPVGRPSFAKKASCPELGGPFTIPAYLNNDSVELLLSLHAIRHLVLPVRRK